MCSVYAIICIVFEYRVYSQGIATIKVGHFEWKTTFTRAMSKIPAKQFYLKQAKIP